MGGQVLGRRGGHWLVYMVLKVLVSYRRDGWGAARRAREVSRGVICGFSFLCFFGFGVGWLIVV